MYYITFTNTCLLSVLLTCGIISDMILFLQSLSTLSSTNLTRLTSLLKFIVTHSVPSVKFYVYICVFCVFCLIFLHVPYNLDFTLYTFAL